MRNAAWIVMLAVISPGALLIAAPPVIDTAPITDTASAVSPTTMPASNAPAERGMRSAVRQTFKFDSVALTDALDAVVRDTLGLNLVVDWPAIEAAGIDKSTPVTLQLNRGVRARKAIELILDAAGGSIARLTWYVDGGIVHVTTMQQAERVVVTRVYPVQDLIVDVPNFNDAGFDLYQNQANSAVDPTNATAGGNGGQSPFTNNNNSRDDRNGDGLTRQERGEQLVRLVSDMLEARYPTPTTGTPSWRVAYFNGNLVVTAPKAFLDGTGR